MNELLDLLTEAREYFREHGGAQGVMFKDDGTVCAVGALHRCAYKDRLPISLREMATRRLNGAARELYRDKLGGLTPTIFDVNDQWQTDYWPDYNHKAAVLTCYNKAIEDLENDA